MFDDTLRSALSFGEGSDASRSGRLPVQGDIGFVGLGRMGSAMAANLAAFGHRVIAYVRQPQHMGKLLALGLKPTTDLTDLFDCEVVISMLPGDRAVREVVFGRQDIDGLDREGLGVDCLAMGLMPGAIHLSMSTVGVGTSARLASEHARFGQGYVAAPVFGDPDAARSRRLTVVVAGVPVDVERCRPLIDILGQQIFLIGTDCAHASLVKLLGNTVTATALEALAEVIALIRKRGLDPKPFVDILTNTLFGGRVHRLYGERIVAEHYTPGFAFPFALNDVQLVLAEAERAAVPMPTVSVVRDRLVTGIARGHTRLDWSALGLVAMEESAVNVEVGPTHAPFAQHRSSHGNDDKATAE